MIKIAITGGIGSGKTYVSSMLERMGIAVYNADENSKRITATSSVLREKLISVVGEDCYMGCDLNKKRLAQFIFSSKENRLLVNSIIHPLVYEDFLKWSAEKADSAIVAMESAILYEAGFDKYVDKVVMIHAPLEIRISRAMQRDSSTKEEVMARISAQMDDDEKCRLADYVVENDGLCELKPQLDRIIEELMTNLDNNNLGV